MHGRFYSGGLANEQNPLVFVDAHLSSYLHLISNQEPNVGHLDGVLSMARFAVYRRRIDLRWTGADKATTGAIYQIKEPPSIHREPGRCRATGKLRQSL